jgi:hypothetical protein
VAVSPMNRLKIELESLLNAPNTVVMAPSVLQVNRRTATHLPHLFSLTNYTCHNFCFALSTPDLSCWWVNRKTYQQYLPDERGHRQG